MHAALLSLSITPVCGHQSLHKLSSLPSPNSPSIVGRKSIHIRISKQSRMNAWGGQLHVLPHRSPQRSCAWIEALPSAFERRPVWGRAIEILSSSWAPLIRCGGSRPGSAGVCLQACWPLSTHGLPYWSSVPFTFHSICLPAFWQPTANYWSDSAYSVRLICSRHCRWSTSSTTLGSFLGRNREDNLHANMLWI